MDLAGVGAAVGECCSWECERERERSRGREREQEREREREQDRERELDRERDGGLYSPICSVSMAALSSGDTGWLRPRLRWGLRGLTTVQQLSGAGSSSTVLAIDSLAAMVAPALALTRTGARTTAGCG